MTAPGDRVRIVGRRHPWRGAVGIVEYGHRQYGQDWVLRLDAPHGVEAFGRQSCVAEADIEPEYKPAAEALFELGAAPEATS